MKRFSHLFSIKLIDWNALRGAPRPPPATVLPPQVYLHVAVSCLLMTQVSPAHITDMLVGSAAPAGKRLRQPTVLEVITDKKNLDLTVAEFFYATGTPLHLVRSPWSKKMCKAISNSYVPYSGPGYQAMRTSLLHDIKKRVDESCVTEVDEEAQAALLNESNQVSVATDSDELREIAGIVAEDDALPMCDFDSNDGADSD
ncbi:hypothetical protein ABBQ32_010529 [Trebouxia sp. C0010 RCD-2024]